MRLRKLLYSSLVVASLLAVAVSAHPSSGLGFLQTRLSQFGDQTLGLDPNALKLGLMAYTKIKEEGLARGQILTIVDYTKPSTARRLWVLDLVHHTVLFNTYVAHGKNSGETYPRAFSDSPSSLQSSLGVFLTESSYEGSHGYSLRVKGLERGFNGRAESRAIIVHGAEYATENFARTHGHLGRSYGCFAVSPTIVNALIHTIKDGTVIFAYYPDPSWLLKSQFISS